MLLAQVQLGVTLTDVIDKTGTPPPTIVQISTIWICNVTNASRTVTLRIGVPTLTTANSLFENNSIPANDTWVVGSAGEFVGDLNAGMKIQGLCDSANGVTVTVFGTFKP